MLDYFINAEQISLKYFIEDQTAEGDQNGTKFAENKEQEVLHSFTASETGDTNRSKANSEHNSIL